MVFTQTIVSGTVALLLPLGVAGPPILPPSDAPAVSDEAAPSDEAGTTDTPGPAADAPPPTVHTNVNRPLPDPIAGPHTVADPFAAEQAEEGRPRIIRPIPRWKLVGLGVSGGLAVTSFTAAIGIAIAVSRATRDKGRLASNIRDAVADTPELPIDPSLSISETCDVALTTPRGSDIEGGVYNSPVGRYCQRGHALAATGTVMLITGALSLVSTAVFTGLLFAKPRATGSLARRHDVRLGGGGTRESASLGLTGRF